jgi:hypothetical protein
MANNPISAPPSGNTTRSNAGQNRKNPFVSMDISGVEPTKVTVAKSLEEAMRRCPPPRRTRMLSRQPLTEVANSRGCSLARVSTMRA